VRRDRLRLLDHSALTKSSIEGNTSKVVTNTRQIVVASYCRRWCYQSRSFRRRGAIELFNSELRTIAKTRLVKYLDLFQLTTFTTPQLPFRSSFSLLPLQYYHSLIQLARPTHPLLLQLRELNQSRVNPHLTQSNVN